MKLHILWAAVFALVQCTESFKVDSHDFGLVDQQRILGEGAAESSDNTEATKQKTKKNLIFMVSDGMGPASISLARSFRQFRDDLPIDDILTLDKHFIGHSRTRASNSLVTDSAAGATAFSCGFKSYNGAIAVLPNQRPCGTVLEAAKLAGYMTGLVVTTRITDATPACFSSHVNYRSEEDLIALHQLGNYTMGRVVDLMMGGGRIHFRPEGRADGQDLIERAISEGWSYVDDRAGFDSLQGGNNVTFPLLALLADYDIPYDIDRNSTIHPSIEEETRTALRALEKATKDSDKGFFVLIEGSRIDHAGHQNDPAAQVRETLAYDAAFKAAIEFADSSDVETVIVSTSDHETGGLATALQTGPQYPNYAWYPEFLLNAKHSGEYLARKLREYPDDGTRRGLEKFVIEEIFIDGLGIKEFTKHELSNVILNKNNAIDYLVKMVSKRSETGWSTHGHSAVDVNVYAYSPTEEGTISLLKELGGSNENTDVGKFLSTFLEVDVEKVSKTLEADDELRMFDYYIEEEEEMHQLYQHEEYPEDEDTLDVSDEDTLDVSDLNDLDESVEGIE